MMTSTKYKCGIFGLIWLPINWMELYPKSQNKIKVSLGNDIFITAKSVDQIKEVINQITTELEA